MPQEYIEIRGARENNLKNVSLRIPKRKITIFTGVSGSGKSSIVFDTIAAEARRQLNETFSTFVRNFLPRYAQPDADAIENLSMAIVVDQKHLGGGSHSTVGTITDYLFSVTVAVLARRAAVRGLFQCLFVQRPAGHVSGVQWHWPQDRRRSRQVS
jgi:excinuclease UvrABC ATPase subunit